MEGLDFTPVVKAILDLVLTACSILITTKVIPYIKSKLSENELEYVKIIVKLVVQAAEQLFDKAEGAAKKEYALERIQVILNERGIVMDIAAIDALIEGFVLELHRELAE